MFSIDIAVTELTAIKGGAFAPVKMDISVTGNGFLYNMVRIIAGTLVYVGMGKLTPEDVKEIIDSRDRTRAGNTLPPEGLTLVSVEYED